jgi:hypothetical protein
MTKNVDAATDGSQKNEVRVEHDPRLLRYAVRVHSAEAVSDIVELGFLLHDAELDLDELEVKDQRVEVGIDRVCWNRAPTEETGFNVARSVLTLWPVAAVRYTAPFELRLERTFDVRYASASRGWQQGVEPYSLTLVGEEGHQIEFEFDGCGQREVSLADVELLCSEQGPRRQVWRVGTLAYDKARAQLALDARAAAARAIEHMESDAQGSLRKRRGLSVDRVLARHRLLVDRYFVFRSETSQPVDSLSGVYVDGETGEVSLRRLMGRATHGRVGRVWTLHW